MELDKIVALAIASIVMVFAVGIMITAVEYQKGMTEMSTACVKAGKQMIDTNCISVGK